MSKWTPQKRMALIYLAAGYSDAQVRKKLGVGKVKLEMWKEDPDWAPMLDELASRHAEAMQGLLEDAERLAVATMATLMNSPDDDVRFKAAESILNRAGKRGKPIDQVEQKSVSVTGDINKALATALRDPGVLQRLEGANIKLLEAGAEAARSAAEVRESQVVEVDYETIPESGTGPRPPAVLAKLRSDAERSNEDIPGEPDEAGPDLPDVAPGDDELFGIEGRLRQN